MTDPVTRARSLLAAATPGPWELKDDDPRFEPCVKVGHYVLMDLHVADAALIAAAPRLLAELVAENDRLREVMGNLISWEYGGWNGLILTQHREVEGEGRCRGCDGLWPCAIEQARAALTAEEPTRAT